MGNTAVNSAADQSAKTIEQELSRRSTEDIMHAFGVSLCIASNPAVHELIFGTIIKKTPDKSPHSILSSAIEEQRDINELLQENGIAKMEVTDNGSKIKFLTSLDKRQQGKVNSESYPFSKTVSRTQYKITEHAASPGVVVTETGDQATRHVLHKDYQGESFSISVERVESKVFYDENGIATTRIEDRKSFNSGEEKKYAYEEPETALNLLDHVNPTYRLEMRIEKTDDGDGVFVSASQNGEQIMEHSLQYPEHADELVVNNILRSPDGRYFCV